MIDKWIRSKRAHTYPNRCKQLLNRLLSAIKQLRIGEPFLTISLSQDKYFFLNKTLLFSAVLLHNWSSIERNLRHFLRSFHNYYVISNIIWNKREGILCSGPVWASHLLCILSVVISSFATSEHIYRFLSDLPPKESIVWQTYVCIEKNPYKIYMNIEQGNFVN